MLPIIITTPNSDFIDAQLQFPYSRIPVELMAFCPVSEDAPSYMDSAGLANLARLLARYQAISALTFYNCHFSVLSKVAQQKFLSAMQRAIAISLRNCVVSSPDIFNAFVPGSNVFLRECSIHCHLNQRQLSLMADRSHFNGVVIMIGSMIDACAIYLPKGLAIYWRRCVVADMEISCPFQSIDLKTLTQ